MKLNVLVLSSLTILFSGCYGPGSQVAGTMIGANVGGHIGGMIGGRSGGFGGDIFGTVLGTVAGAAIGHAVTTPPEERYDATTRQGNPSYEFSAQPSYERPVQKENPALEDLRVVNLRFIDENRNRVINSEETCQLIFEVSNPGTQTVRNITPNVYEVNRMKRLYISNPAVIDILKPGERVKYTVTIRSGSKLQQGTATFAIELSDVEGNVVPCREFDITTAR